MITLFVRNVNDALPIGLGVLAEHGVERESRYGKVRTVPVPVTTHYLKPNERVIFHPIRDANPFFHLMESLWMLAGREDVDFVARYAERMRSFSDDGKVLHGAYGFRWRNKFGMDQLSLIINALRQNKDDRRQVLQMWSASDDLGRGGKDVPCNVTATFQINADGKLDMSVFNRSNDIVWGCYGANAVHFSALLEYMATSIGVEVGGYWQISVNWHGYIATAGPLMEAGPDAFMPDCPYSLGEVQPYPLMQTPQEVWDRDLTTFLKFHAVTRYYSDPFFQEVALPIAVAWNNYKTGQGEGRFESALTVLQGCAATDWRRACVEWIQRRHAKFKREMDDGPTPDQFQGETR